MEDINNISDVEKLEIVIRDILLPVAFNNGHGYDNLTELLLRLVEKEAETDKEKEPWSRTVYLKGYSKVKNRQQELSEMDEPTNQIKKYQHQYDV